MQVMRIGDKVISLGRIHLMVEQAMALRAQGLSQSEVAHRLGVDRSLVSRLESLGEIRKGHAIAVIGFPVANRPAIEAVCQELGVEFVWLMTDRERRAFAESLSGAALIDQILKIAARVRQFDAVVLMASNERIRLMQALLNPGQVVPLVLGETPLEQDVTVDVEALRHAILAVRGEGEG
jgi:DNA-binding transcriptional regulator LsrR (DeoR family)